MFPEMLRKGLKQLTGLVPHPAFLLTLGLIGWVEAIFTIEWSFPYCSSQEDGPASAVFGMPLPYIRWTGVSSLEYIFMPSIFIVNLLILFVIASPFIFWAVKKVAAPEQRRRRRMLSFAGLILFLSISFWTILLERVGVYRPVSTIGDEAYGRYSQFRPVRISFNDLHYDCTPSNYWFKDGWRPQREKATSAAN